MKCQHCGETDHNPAHEPTGHFTGRCMKCGSKHLWDDAAAYGCNCCGALYIVADIPPRVIENATGRDLGPAWDEHGTIHRSVAS